MNTFRFVATAFVQQGYELAPGDWSEETRCAISKLREFYPEISHWGDLAIGSAFCSFSRDFLEVSWADWMLDKRDDIFLCYCCLMQLQGNCPFHCCENELLKFDEWRG